MFRRLSMLFAIGLLAGAAHAQEREWMLDASDEDAYLIFGVPETDDGGISLWCRIGKGTVSGSPSAIASSATSRSAPSASADITATGRPG